MEIVLVIGIVAVIGLLIVVLLQGKNKPPDTGMLVMQQQVDALRQQITETIAGNTTALNQQLSSVTQQVNQQLAAMVQQLQNATGQIGTRLDNAARVVGEVKQNLGELSKATQQVFDVGKDIASLQEILRAPKLRGILGELFLGDLLAQILPPNHFTLQHRFKSGEAVDAVIRLGQFLVPVDSKFPLENFRRVVESKNDEERKAARKKFNADVKKHADAIADKYILPDEGTFPFALMYIPAENVYYETIIKDENLGDEKSLSAYALERKVIPVSPNSLYAYLQAIVMGLKGLQIEKSAQIIISHLERLRGDFERFRKEFEVIGTHLTNAKGRYEEASIRLDRFGERLISAGQGDALPGELKDDPLSLNPHGERNPSP
ncbi:MAG TPA: DNA recombination protein RmuC [Nitrospiria bacterium]|jgi:DNA recombination protein RmuC|nr:DNA recombination protein RmuC [Nitrospiria bacterium]